MAWENTATVITGDLITASQWNRDRNNQEWLARDHWRAEMTRVTDQTGVVTGAFTAVDFTAITYDFGSLASTVNDEFTIPTFPSGITTALMAFEGEVIFDSNQTGERLLQFTNKGTGVDFGRLRHDGGFSEISTYAEVEATTGQTFGLEVFQDSGANRTLTGSILTLKFRCRWLAWQD